MAQITDLGVAGISSGIIMPMIRNRWRVEKVSILSEEENDIIRLQAIKLHYKFKSPSKFGFKQLHDLLLVVEEDIGARVTKAAQKLVETTEPFDITVCVLDGNIDVLKTVTFKNCRAEGYDYGLDYAASEACKFPLEFTFEDLINE